jgi:hypothetical protein
MPSYRLYLCVFLSLLVLSASQVSAAIIPPPGLNPGDHYRLVFVTEGSRDATSSNIDDYNQFVTDEAHRPGSVVDGIPTSWRAIASTVSVDAIANTFTRPSDNSAPIYNLFGNLVASGGADLWDQSIAAPIDSDQFGMQTWSYTWTGTTPLGGSGGMFGLALGQVNPEKGLTVSNSLTWVTEYYAPQTIQYPLYAISGDLVVPAAVPEPATLLLFGVGSVVMLGAARFRRKQV